MHLVRTQEQMLFEENEKLKKQLKLTMHVIYEVKKAFLHWGGYKDEHKLIDEVIQKVNELEQG